MIYSKVRRISIWLELIDSLADQIAIVVAVEDSLDAVATKMLDALITWSRVSKFALSIESNHYQINSSALETFLNGGCGSAHLSLTNFALVITTIIHTEGDVPTNRRELSLVLQGNVEVESSDLTPADRLEPLPGVGCS